MPGNESDAVPCERLRQFQPNEQPRGAETAPKPHQGIPDKAEQGRRLQASEKELEPQIKKSQPDGTQKKSQDPLSQRAFGGKPHPLPFQDETAAHAGQRGAGRHNPLVIAVKSQNQHQGEEEGKPKPALKRSRFKP